MSTIIRTRTPYFIRTTNYASPTYSIDYFQVVITVHGGSSGSVPACDNLYATYTLRKKIIPTETSVTLEISEIVNDHLIQTFNGNYTTSALTQSIWVNVVVTGYQTTGAAISPAVTTNYLAQEGFNTFKNGVNYTTEPTAMITPDYMQYSKSSNITIPINKERVNSVAWKNNGSTISTVSITDSGSQAQKISYPAVNPASQEYDQIVITYDTTSTRTITLEETSECKYETFKVTFLNRWGALQDLFFFKKSVESLNVERENFNRSIFKAKKVTLSPPEGGGDCDETITYNSYSTTDHADKTFNVNGRESIQLNTGFVNELLNPSFEELMVSEYIWLTDSDSVVYPVKLKDSSLTSKTKLNDRMINYAMNFEMAFDYANNIS
jgi:hypothetical protein